MPKPAKDFTRNELLTLLRSFIAQRPGLDPRDYGDWQAYRREAAEISRDYRDAMTLLRSVEWREGIDAEMIRSALQGSGRLTLSDDGRLHYCAGQYFPTEYRPAAARVLAGLLWRYVCNDITESRKGDPSNMIYMYGSVADTCRAWARREFGPRSRIARFYFN